MDGLWVCYKQLGVWCGVIFISRVWILCLIPLLSRRLGNCFKFCQTIWRCPHSPTCRNQTAQRMKTGIYSFENGIITYILEKNSQFLYLFQRKHGEQKFIYECYSLYCHLPDGAATKRTQCCYGEWQNSTAFIIVQCCILPVSSFTFRHTKLAESAFPYY